MQKVSQKLMNRTPNGQVMRICRIPNQHLLLGSVRCAARVWPLNLATTNAHAEQHIVVRSSLAIDNLKFSNIWSQIITSTIIYQYCWSYHFIYLPRIYRPRHKLYIEPLIIWQTQPHFHPLWAEPDWANPTSNDDNPSCLPNSLIGMLQRCQN